MKKNDEVKKSRKARAEKKAASKPRLTKEEREARKLKLQEERAAKKAARIAKREAKKQKEAEKKAAAKAKREERKAKKAARLQKQKELLAKKREAKKMARILKKHKEHARLAKKRERLEKIRAAKKTRLEEKRAKAEKKGRALPKEAKLSAKEKIEAERNEWKALSAIRRYVKDNAKILAGLDGDKLERKLKKLEKMGYTVLRGPDGKLLNVGYSFEADIKISGEKPAGGEKKPRKRRVKNVEDEEVQQPQNSEAEPLPEEEELLTDDEILEAAKADNGGEGVEVLAGDTFADEAEVAANAEEIENDAGDDKDEDEDEDEDDADENNDEGVDILGDTGISREQEEYRHEAFREMEANGTWD